MKELIKFLDQEAAKVNNATDKNAAVSETLRNIRDLYKLDLKDVVELNNNLEFIYKIENVTAAAVYIAATAKKSPKVWKNISYIVL